MTQRLRFYALMIALAVPASAAAQAPRPAANPAQSVLQDQSSDQPIQIEAATLEVHDKSKMATFSGDVQVVQGDTTIKCQSLVVFYGPEHGGGAGQNPAGQNVASASPPAANAPAGTKTLLPQGQQDIRRIEARGGVTVVSKDQNASGDLGVYDLKKKEITLTGNVVVSQGKNVLHGDRVVVDTVTGTAHFESAGPSAGGGAGAGAGAAPPGRVRALILPSKNANGGSSNVMTLGPPKTN